MVAAVRSCAVSVSKQSTVSKLCFQLVSVTIAESLPQVRWQLASDAYLLPLLLTAVYLVAMFMCQGHPRKSDAVLSTQSEVITVIARLTQHFVLVYLGLVYTECS